MKIINTHQNNYVIAEDGQGGVIVHDENFKREWEIYGIVIPQIFSPEFGNQERVKLGDFYFRKALIEIYYPLNMDHAIFKLIDHSPPEK
jgi:hypothetical protein